MSTPKLITAIATSFFWQVYGIFSFSFQRVVRWHWWDGAWHYISSLSLFRLLIQFYILRHCHWRYNCTCFIFSQIVIVETEDFYGYDASCRRHHQNRIIDWFLQEILTFLRLVVLSCTTLLSSTTIPNWSTPLWSSNHFYTSWIVPDLLKLIAVLETTSLYLIFIPYGLLFSLFNSASSWSLKSLKAKILVCFVIP